MKLFYSLIMFFSFIGIELVASDKQLRDYFEVYTNSLIDCADSNKDKNETLKKIEWAVQNIKKITPNQDKKIFHRLIKSDNLSIGIKRKINDILKKLNVNIDAGSNADGNLLNFYVRRLLNAHPGVRKEFIIRIVCLLELGASLNIENGQRIKALFKAIPYHDVELVEILLFYGANPFDENRSKKSALMYCQDKLKSAIELYNKEQNKEHSDLIVAYTEIQLLLLKKIKDIELLRDRARKELNDMHIIPNDVIKIIAEYVI